MKTLLLLSRVPQSKESPSAEAACVPVSEAQALQAALAGPDSEVEVLDARTLTGDSSLFTRLVCRLGGPDIALAVMAFRRRRGYDVVFSDREQVALPLAILFRTVPGRPAHVAVALRLHKGRARWLFSLLGLRRSFDALFVYTQAQRDYAEDSLGISVETISLISPQVDDHFFRPASAIVATDDRICAAARQEEADPALHVALSALPELTLTYTQGCRGRKGDDCPALRDAYAQSSFVVVPQAEADPASAATILQAMAMGKAVIATYAEGRTDMIVEGVTGLTVLPGDVEGWRRAILRLHGDRALRERLGHNARRWVEENAAQDRWARRIAEMVRLSAAPVSSLSDAEMWAPPFHSFH